MNLPAHCLENSIFINKGDYMNFEKFSRNIKTRLEFSKIPNFYTIDGQPYFATEMQVEGLKVVTAALATDSILNIRLQELTEPYIIKNVNFLIPNEADVKLTTVEVTRGNTISIRAPLNLNNNLLNKISLK